MRSTKDESEINLANGEAEPEFSEWKWASPEEVIEQVCYRYFLWNNQFQYFLFEELSNTWDKTDYRRWTTKGQRMRKWWEPLSLTWMEMQSPQNVNRLNGECCGYGWTLWFYSSVHDLLNFPVKFGFSRSLLFVNGNDSKNWKLDGCFIVTIRSLSNYVVLFSGFD